jgi:hypothetical protein
MERIIVWGGRRVCIIAEAFEGVFLILNQQLLIRVIFLRKSYFIQVNFSFSWVARSSLSWLMPLVCQPVTALDRVQCHASPCGCVVKNVALGQASTSLVSCQNHSKNAPY